jgi:Outer membrane protein beta-barrel family
MKTRYRTAVNGGAQKVIMKGKGNLRLNFNDIFKTINWYGTSNFTGQNLLATAFSDPQNVVIGFSYKVGSNQVKAAREHPSGIDEESKRAAASSGN